MIADGQGRKAIFSIIDEDIDPPYTIQSMMSIQHALSRTLAVEVGYIRTNGKDFPLQRQFTLARDRVTGAMPNPDASITASDFGRITSASGNRSIQIGARYSF